MTDYGCVVAGSPKKCKDVLGAWGRGSVGVQGPRHDDRGPGNRD